MRIIAGNYKGRRIEVPDRGVRPTQDRVRESLFAMLGELLVDADVLDLYAGSGALGLEALSRGARSVGWVESDRRNFQVLKRNIDVIANGECSGTINIVCLDAIRFLERSAVDKYNLIFADPPYCRDSSDSVFPHLLAALEKSQCLAPQGLFVYETNISEVLGPPREWEILRDKTWGETRVVILQSPVRVS